MNSEADAVVVARLYENAKRLEEQAAAIQSEAMDLRQQAREIESRYEFLGPCIGCDRYKSCPLAGTCAAMDQCGKARDLAGVAA
jgi:hypothetical protein